MLRMPLGQVQPGMILAAPVPNPRQLEYDLLKAGYELTADMIGRLRDMGVRTVWISYPSMDFLDEAISPKLTAQQQQVYSTLKKSFSVSQQHVVARMDFQEYRRTLKELIQAIAAQRVDALMIDPLTSQETDLFAHCSNVAYLALMLGVKLGHYVVQQRARLDPRHARDVMNLGLGALVHDLGKMRLPAELRNYQPTSADESPADWQAHAEYGFEMIHGKVEPSACQIALYHHQRWDGRGFPVLENTGKPAAGQQIHIFSRIVAVANWFELEIHRAAISGLPTVVAMKQLRGQPFRGFFDPVVFRAFSDLVPPFPIGSLVGLSDGSQAVVLMHNPNEPCLPTVRRIGDKIKVDAGSIATSMEEEDTELAAQKDLTIVTADGIDVEPFLFSADEGMSNTDPGRLILGLPQSIS